MKRKVLLALGAAAAIAVGGMTMDTAQAKTHVYLGFGVGVPWGYYYPPAPYWGYYPPAPYYYYPAPRYRVRCWRVKRWRRVWNGRRWVKRRIWVRKCRRVRVW